MVRKALESLYKGVCTVYQYESVVDPITKRTSLVEVVSCADQPCRLSHSNTTSAKTSDTVSTVTQTIKLFIAPEVVINAGAKIAVTQNGVTKTYIAGGQSAVYTNHQEIVLEIEDGLA